MTRIMSTVQAIGDGDRRETLLFGSLAVVLVVIRSAVFTLSEDIYFDSDQAIVGLMAKHLSEFRTFPLFYYGLNYMLGVQAWIMAPFFWIAPASVTVMRVPLVMLNALAAVILIRSLHARINLRPALGFVAALPFIMPTPVVAGALLDTNGSAVEPVIYVLLLWMLRERPVAFGALLAFGFLHREFTVYAIPALVVVHAVNRSFWTTATVKRAGLAAAGFALVWLVVDDLKLHLAGSSAILQAVMLSRQACFQVAELYDRIRYVFMACLPVLAGASVMPLSEFAMRSQAVVGSHLVGWIVVAAMGIMMIRLPWLWYRTADRQPWAFGAYLALVGGVTLAAYPLACTFVGTSRPTLRYLQLALLLPVGCCAMFLARESSAKLRAVVVTMVVVWAGANLVDNLRVIQMTRTRPELDPHRELADFLVTHRIQYARANYWDAYIVDFFARERVVVGSYGPVRIPEYERQVDEAADGAVNIERMPCEGETRVAGWCIQSAAR